MEKPSIALIPSAYKNGKVYSVLPNNGDGDFDFTRGSTATRVNENGLIEDVATGVPRLDYSDGGCPVLLLEPQSTNLATYSEAFDNAAWVKSQATVTPNVIISPNGSLSADKLVEGTGSSGSYVSSAIISVSTGQITNSIWLKSGERTEAVIFEQVTVKGIYIDLENGTFIQNLVNPPDNYTIVKGNDGWVKVSITTTNTTTSRMRIYPSLNGSVGYQGDGISGIYIYGAQLEELSYPTSYIPTVGTTVTRVADACNNAGTVNDFNSAEGSFYCEFQLLQDVQVNSTYICLSDGGTSASDNTVVLQFRNNGSIRLYAEGLSTIVAISSSSYDFTELHKIAVRYSVNDWSLYIDGVKITNSTSTIPAVAGLNTLDFNLWYTVGTTAFVGGIKDSRIYKTGLTESELATLTTL